MLSGKSPWTAHLHVKVEGVRGGGEAVIHLGKSMKAGGHRVTDLGGLLAVSSYGEL